MTPLFLSIDGCDGTGKSTQMELLTGWLTSSGHDVVVCRDPGSTPLGEEVRGLLLDRADLQIHRRSEMLLYMAARAQLVEEIIRPALESGKTVVSDRYLLANVVYQGHAGGLDVETLWEVGRIATDSVSPRSDASVGHARRGGFRAIGAIVGSDGTAGGRVSRAGSRRLPGGGKATSGRNPGDRRFPVD